MKGSLLKVYRYDEQAIILKTAKIIISLLCSSQGKGISECTEQRTRRLLVKLILSILKTGLYEGIL